MPALRCDIWWSATQLVTLRAEPSQLVRELVTAVRFQAGERLPESDGAGVMLEYVLFKASAGERVPLRDPHQTLAQAQLRDGDVLWLADRRRPWWRPQPAAEATQRQLVAASRPNCFVHITEGVALAVPTAGLELSRDYLLDHLPRSLLVHERALSRTTQRSRLQAVSRQRHCSLLPSAAGWQLQAHAATFVAGHCYNHGMTLPLPSSTTLLLGREGWPVAVRLAEPLAIDLACSPRLG